MQWKIEEVRALYHKPFLDLIFEAAGVHRAHHQPTEIQLCTLLSIKTGGCPENCHYCPQSAHYDSKVERTELMAVSEVISQAKAAKNEGSTRFCMGAAWREVKDGKEFDSVIEMVEGVGNLGLEVCCTLGMITESQAMRLKEAGLTAYNHNLDTSEGHYESIIQTRQYQDRLKTIQNVSKAGISVCCGGIIGLGEKIEDRIQLLHQLTQLNPQPESIPINTLVPVEGTPLENQEIVNPLDWIRMIAATRILMPKSKVRLSAGRKDLPEVAQTLAFLAGANSIFTGDKLLTTANPQWSADKALMDSLGLTPQVSKQSVSQRRKGQVFGNAPSVTAYS